MTAQFVNITVIAQTNLILVTQRNTGMIVLIVIMLGQRVITHGHQALVSVQPVAGHTHTRNQQQVLKLFLVIHMITSGIGNVQVVVTQTGAGNHTARQL